MVAYGSSVSALEVEDSIKDTSSVSNIVSLTGDLTSGRVNEEVIEVDSSGSGIISESFVDSALVPEAKDASIREDMGNTIVEVVADNDVTEVYNDLLAPKPEGIHEVSSTFNTMNYHIDNTKERPSDKIVIDNPYTTGLYVSEHRLYDVQGDNDMVTNRLHNENYARNYAESPQYYYGARQVVGTRNVYFYLSPKSLDLRTEVSKQEALGNFTRFTGKTQEEDMYEYIVSRESYNLRNVENLRYNVALKDLNPLDASLYIPETVMAEAKASYQRLQTAFNRLTNVTTELEKANFIATGAYYALEGRYNTYKTGRVHQNIILDRGSKLDSDIIKYIDFSVKNLPPREVAQLGATYLTTRAKVESILGSSGTGLALDDGNFTIVSHDVSSFDAMGTYIHELGHIVDFSLKNRKNPEVTLSSTPEFNRVFSSEIVGRGAVTDYAKTNRYEGWAELYRLYRVNNYKEVYDKIHSTLGSNVRTTYMGWKATKPLKDFMVNVYSKTYNPLNRVFSNISIVTDSSNDFGKYSIHYDKANSSVVIKLGSRGTREVSSGTIEERLVEDELLKEGERVVVEGGSAPQTIKEVTYVYDSVERKLKKVEKTNTVAGTPKVVRVGAKREVEIVVPYTTTYIENSNLEAGVRRVKVVGVNGTSKKAPINQVIEVGTKKHNTHF